MKSGVIWCVIASAAFGLGLYLSVGTPEQPPIDEPTPPPAAPAPPAPPACPPAPPVVLPDVVSVTDLDPLLEPPAKPITGETFDKPSAKPALMPDDPEFIPRAID